MAILRVELWPNLLSKVQSLRRYRMFPLESTSFYTITNYVASVPGVFFAKELLVEGLWILHAKT